MQRLTPEAADFGKAVAGHRIGHLAASHRLAIHRIADHPVPEMRHVNADLVRAAGLQPAFHDAGKRRQPADHRPVGGGIAAVRHHRLFLAVARRPAKRGLDPALGFRRHAPGDRQVVPVEIMRREHLGQLLVRGIAFRRHHHPGCVLVQPVDDARAHHPADAGQAVAAMGDQRVDEGAVGLARAGMDHHAGRLVEDDDVVVLEHDIQRDVLGLRCRLAHWRQQQRVFRLGPHRLRRVGHGGAVLGHRAVEDQRLQPRPRQRRGGLEPGGKEPVETLSGGLWRGGDGQSLHVVTGHGTAG